MVEAIGQVTPLDRAGHGTRPPGGPRDQCDVTEVPAHSAFARRTREESHRAELLHRQPCPQQLLFRDPGALEHLVKPGRCAGEVWNGRRDAPHVRDEGISAFIELVAMDPLGDRARISGGQDCRRRGMRWAASS
jgi:hypothetical protein